MQCLAMCENLMPFILIQFLSLFIFTHTFLFCVKISCHSSSSFSSCPSSSKLDKFNINLYYTVNGKFKPKILTCLMVQMNQGVPRDLRRRNIIKGFFHYGWNSDDGDHNQKSSDRCPSWPESNVRQLWKGYVNWD